MKFLTRCFLVMVFGATASLQAMATPSDADAAHQVQREAQQNLNQIEAQNARLAPTAKRNQVLAIAVGVVNAAALGGDELQYEFHPQIVPVRVISGGFTTVSPRPNQYIRAQFNNGWSCTVVPVYFSSVDAYQWLIKCLDQNKKQALWQYLPNRW